MSNWEIDKFRRTTGKQSRVTNAITGPVYGIAEEVLAHHREIKEINEELDALDSTKPIFKDGVEVPNVNWGDKLDVTTFEEYVESNDQVIEGINEELDRIEGESKDRDTTLQSNIDTVSGIANGNTSAIETLSTTKADKTFVEEQDSLLQDQITINKNSIIGNTSSIQDINNVLEGNARKEFIADVVLTNPTITEGSWTTINWTPTLEEFPQITYNGDGTFTTSEAISKLDFKVSGQTENTNANKTVSIRLWNTTTNTQYGETQSETIIASGKVVYEDVIQNLPIGTYRIEITSTVGAGSITFTNGKIYLISYGTGATVSSVFADGVNVGDVNWSDKADKTYVDTELDSKVDKSNLPYVDSFQVVISSDILNGSEGKIIVTFSHDSYLYNYGGVVEAGMEKISDANNYYPSTGAAGGTVQIPSRFRRSTKSWGRYIRIDGTGLDGIISNKDAFQAVIEGSEVVLKLAAGNFSGATADFVLNITVPIFSQDDYTINSEFPLGPWSS